MKKKPINPNNGDDNFAEFIRDEFNASAWDIESEFDFSKLSLFHFVREQWEQRSIYVGGIDTDDINAVAFEHDGSECIGITRGTFEQLNFIFGLVASSMKEPFFDFDQPWDDLKRWAAQRLRKGHQNELQIIDELAAAWQKMTVKLGRRDPFKDDEKHIAIKRVEKVKLTDDQRALWRALLDISLVFIIFHELGHLVSGHIYWLQHGLKKKRAALFEYPLFNKSNHQLLDVNSNDITALEVDADTDAVTQTLQFLDGISYPMATNENRWLNLLAQYDTRYPIIDISFNIVFILFSHQSKSIEDYHGSHPHPDIRGAYCNGGVLTYCSQSNQPEALQAYSRWRKSPKLADFYWEMQYVLKGPYFFKDYDSNAKSMEGRVPELIQKLWQDSRATWDVVAKYADERRNKLYSANESKKP